MPTAFGRSLFSRITFLLLSLVISTSPQATSAGNDAEAAKIANWASQLQLTPMQSAMFAKTVAFYDQKREEELPGSTRASENVKESGASGGMRFGGGRRGSHGSHQSEDTSSAPGQVGGEESAGAILKEIEKEEIDELSGYLTKAQLKKFEALTKAGRSPRKRGGS
jgi:hypothetical protein